MSRHGGSMRATAVFLAMSVGCAGSESETDLSSEEPETDDESTTAGEDTCKYLGAFSGGATVDLDYGDAEGCSGSGYDDRLAMSFGILEDGYAAYVEIGSGAWPGQTAEDLPAAVELVDLSVGYDGWRTPEDGCAVTITEMAEDDFFDWIVSGTGSCTGTATPSTEDVTGEVTVEPFEFRAPASYPS